MKQLQELRDKITPHLNKLKETYSKLSDREKKLLLGAIAVALVIGTMVVTRPISTLFSEQAFELSKAEQEARTVASELTRYQRLLQRRSEIEQDFKSVEIKEGALSKVESLLVSKAGIDAGSFNIKDQPPKPFGTEYQQTFFTVSFTTTDYLRLIDFLQELVDGAKPLLLKRMDLKRSRSGDKLDVDLEISSITKERS